LWLQISKARRAAGRERDADRALERAHALLSMQVARVGDAGLRRNTLNKSRRTRDLLVTWKAYAESHALPAARREAHLAGGANLNEPFERLVDTGLRLNEIRNEGELREFIVDEVTELLGAERVLLVLQTEDTLELTGSLLPMGEDE